MSRALASAALVALPLTALAAPAHADPGARATVTKAEDGLSCFQDLVDGPSSTTDAIQVRSSSGVVTLVCHFRDVDSSAGKALRAVGWPCGTPYGITFDSSFTVAPSGIATMVCRIKRS